MAHAASPVLSRGRSRTRRGPASRQSVLKVKPAADRATPARPPRWSGPKFRAVQEYVDATAPLLRLADWTVTVSRELLELDADGEQTPAAITSVARSKKAEMQVSDAFLTLSATEQQQVLVHELVHCHLFWMTEVVEGAFGELGGDPEDGDDLPGAGGSKGVAVALMSFDLELERATDALAEAFAPLLPPFDIDARGRR